jgi:hypothetical protein
LNYLPVILIIVPENLRFISMTELVDKVPTARVVEGVLIDELRMEANDPSLTRNRKL